MISKKSMNELHRAIKKYDKLVNKTYLLAYKKDESTFEFIEIKIEECNFWHLLGCKLPTSKTNRYDEHHHIYYEKCLNGEDISQDLSYAEGHKEKDVVEKRQTIESVFDFVSNAKGLKLSKSGEYNFQLAIGSVIGIIGYNNNHNIYYPKTAQNKDINKIITRTYSTRKLNKITIILSKDNNNLEYNHIEFEAGKDLFAKLADQFKNIPLSAELLQLAKEYKEKIAKLPQEDWYRQIGFLPKKNSAPKVKSGFTIENLQKIKELAASIPKTDTYIIGNLREINMKKLGNNLVEIELVYEDVNNENHDIDD